MMVDIFLLSWVGVFQFWIALWKVKMLTLKTDITRLTVKKFVLTHGFMFCFCPLLGMNYLRFWPAPFCKLLCWQPLESLIKPTDFFCGKEHFFLTLWSDCMFLFLKMVWIFFLISLSKSYPLLFEVSPVFFHGPSFFPRPLPTTILSSYLLLFKGLYHFHVSTNSNLSIIWFSCFMQLFFWSRTVCIVLRITSDAIK